VSNKREEIEIMSLNLFFILIFVKMRSCINLIGFLIVFGNKEKESQYSGK